ncbi:hypothetical protein OH77DRAFT_1406999 [Trametes cingulata]|nr:hypothetical protein OH77DRAFT_1406999 [Trametes cingulata]
MLTGIVFRPRMSCAVCGWRFKQLARYLEHKWLHILTTRCDECSRSFRTPTERFLHLCERHGVAPEST